MRVWVEVFSLLGSMAYGTRSYELLIQYVQASIVSYVLIFTSSLFKSRIILMLLSNP